MKNLVHTDLRSVSANNISKTINYLSKNCPNITSIHVNASLDDCGTKALALLYKNNPKYIGSKCVIPSNIFKYITTPIRSLRILNQIVQVLPVKPRQISL